MQTIETSATSYNLLFFQKEYLESPQTPISGKLGDLNILHNQYVRELNILN